MMAHDPSAPRPDLSVAVITSLHEALGAYLADPSDTKKLESSLRALTKEAREKQVHAEQLLVVLKDIWFSLPLIRGTSPGEPQHALLQRVITQCIREYYSG